MRDPLSPPFQVNFIKGIRIIQFAAILPLHRIAGVTARSIPILFEPVESLAKPKKKAGKEEKAAYNKAKRINTMCDQSVEYMLSLRKGFDAAGAYARTLLFTLDGGFCNRKVFKATLERCRVLARCGKDAKLCFAANDPAHPQKKYAEDKFTPESVHKDESIPFKSGKFFIGGKMRNIRYKEIRNVLWQRRRTRPSCLDLLAMLRKDAIENPELLKSADLSFEPAEACLKAAA